MAMDTPTKAAMSGTFATSEAARPPFPVIVGCPRSGTSMLAVMLDAHPEIAFPPETAFVKHVVSLGGPSDLLRRTFVEIVTTDRAPDSNWTDLGLDRATFAGRMAAIEPFNVTAGLRGLFDMYAAQHGKRRAGEKTPDNTQVIPAIGALLPEAHFIHVIRDPRDTVLSWQKTWFAPTRDPEALGRGWQQFVRAGRQGGAAVAHYLETRYEDLVLRPERELRRICDFLALEYSAAMTDPSAQGAARLARLNGRTHRSGRVITREQRTEIHVNLARPPLPERVGVWRREMSEADRAAVERGAGALLHELGYGAEAA
jgi:hypothetical protein